MHIKIIVSRKNAEVYIMDLDNLTLNGELIRAKWMRIAGCRGFTVFLAGLLPSIPPFKAESRGAI